MEKRHSLQSMVLENWWSTCRRINLDPHEFDWGEYLKYMELNSIKTKQILQLKWAKDLNRHFSQEDI
jgi:hypothetical protein